MDNRLLDYIPKEPFRLSEKTKYPGASLETLIFRDVAYLRSLLRIKEDRWRGGKKDPFHAHLDWILQKLEKLQPVMMCPYCGIRPVKMFSLHQIEMTCFHFCYCGREECWQKMQEEAGGPETLGSFLEIKL